MFWPLLKLQFFVVTMFVFYPKKTKNHFSWHDLCTKHPYEKFRFLDKIHGKILWKNPLEKSFGNCPFFGSFFKLLFFSLKIVLFFHKYRKKIFCDIISVKNTHDRNHDFWTKSWTNPFKKCPFLTLFKTSISST